MDQVQNAEQIQFISPALQLDRLQQSRTPFQDCSFPCLKAETFETLEVASRIFKHSMHLGPFARILWSLLQRPLNVEVSIGQHVLWKTVIVAGSKVIRVVCQKDSKSIYIYGNNARLPELG